MKCPHCHFDRKVKNGMTCRCGYRFTFNPKESTHRGFTDGKFVAAIRKAGQNGTAVYTDNQLYAAYASQAKINRAPALVLAVAVAFFSLLLFWGQPVPVAIGLCIAALLFCVGLLAKANVMSRAKFDQCIDLWKLNGKKVEGLLEETTLDIPPDPWPERDIYDYGVERVLIVQRNILVDLFVKNNQHIEQRMLIISESGYPDYLQERLSALLDERPDLPIFLLHDADTPGRSMKQRLSSMTWLRLGSHPVIDLGFFPSDFQQLKRTAAYRVDSAERALPADALLLGSLTTGLAACFASQTTLAEQLAREQQNAAQASSSFG